VLLASWRFVQKIILIIHLEDLTEALLAFSNVEDLIACLNKQQG
jgi:hypothetical protein